MIQQVDSAFGLSEGQTFLDCRTDYTDMLRRVAHEALMRVARTPGLRHRPTPQPEPEEVAELCSSLLARDFCASRQCIDRLLSDGHSKTAIVLGHMAEAARALGAMWERDEVCFYQVGQSVGRLQRLLRLLPAEAGPRHTDPARRALFATMCGETHTLGVIAAADCLRQKGWQIDLSLGEWRDGLLKDLIEHDYPVLGISIGSLRSLPGLAGLMPDIRRAAPATRILLSGPLLTVSPDVAHRLGAEACASDIATAFESMERLIQARRAA
jgi:methanogenic corrinoid protein MtbC1